MSDIDVQPATKASPAETNVKSKDEASDPKLKVAPAVPGSGKVPAASVLPPAPAAAVPVTTLTTTPEKLADPAVDKTGVFGPSPLPTTPVPPVPLLSELLVALPADKLMPTPVADLSTEHPVLTIPLQSVVNANVLADDKDHPPAEQPKEKKPERWKATPPERRKVIVVAEKTPGK